MNKAFKFFAFVSLLCYHAFESAAQKTNEEFIFEKEMEQTVQLIVMVTVDYDGESTGVGAGIVFANEKDRLFIATASHVIQKGATPARNIFVRFKSAPDKLIKAIILKQINTGESLDLAVLSVGNLAMQGINACAFPFDRLRRQDNLVRKDEVIPIGNPNGRSWAVPVEPDKISEITANEIVFQSSNIKSGHSGGALIDMKANLIGMVTADEAPLGHAMTIDALLRQLKQWKYPVLLSNTNFREDRYDLPMHVAADSGNIAEVKKLLADCNNPNQVDFHYRTPLHYAASDGNIQVMSLLVKAGAMVNVQDFNEMYPINLAISGNHLEAVKFLVTAGAKADNKTFGELTALHWALEKEIHPQIPIYLIQAGANVNAEDEDKNSPLHFAVKMKNLEIVKALIKAGANLEAENSMRTTPLVLAVFNDDLQMLQLLIGSGALVKGSRISKDFTVLHAAAAFSNNSETLKILLKAGASVTATDKFNNTPLHNTVSRAISGKDSLNKLLDFITILLAAGADPNAKNEEGITPLSAARNTQENSNGMDDDKKNRMRAIENLLRKHGGK
ncbi:MAG: ankyrin repeat domain-containing protein [Flavitalea sp.]